MKHIRMQAHEILDRECSICKLTEGMQPYETERYCQDVCSVGKQLFQLDLLLGAEDKQASRRTNWTKREELDLIKLVEQGKSHREIGNILGRSKQSIHLRVKKLRRLGVDVKPPRFSGRKNNAG